jgi:hypothetical protein
MWPAKWESCCANTPTDAIASLLSYGGKDGESMGCERRSVLNVRRSGTGLEIEKFLRTWSGGEKSNPK